MRLNLSLFGGDGMPGSVMDLLVEDVDAFYAKFTMRRVPIGLPRTNETWGDREMYVKDADRNSLRIIA